MSKKRLILTIILSVLGLVVFIVLTAFLLIYLMIKEPSVPKGEKKTVSQYSINYLNNKYGNNEYKVKKIIYTFDSDSLFDYSNPDGYIVSFKCDKVDDFLVFVDGCNPDNYYISDNLVLAYNFPNVKYSFERYDELDKIMPLEKYSDYLCGKIQNEFDPNCQSIEIYHLQLNIPDDFGRIPTMQELKTDINLYICSDFTITLNSEIDEKDKENYKNKLKNYLENNTKFKWSIYYNNNGTISCSFL